MPGSGAVLCIRESNRLDIELYSFAVSEIFLKRCARAGFSPSDKVASRDHYTNELKWRYLLGHFYNMMFYRQICKLRNKYSSAPVPSGNTVGK